jgi:Cu/Ag efflux protein CusF
MKTTSVYVILLLVAFVLGGLMGGIAASGDKLFQIHSTFSESQEIINQATDTIRQQDLELEKLLVENRTLQEANKKNATTSLQLN